MTKILLVDDDPLVLHGLSMIISSETDFTLVGTAENGRDAISLCQKERPDVAVLDIRMPGMDGIETAKVLIQENLSAPLLLTTFDEPDLINLALEAGAKGYILKNSPAKRIVAAIKAVAEGGTVFGEDIMTHIQKMTLPSSRDFFAPLSEREKEIVALIASGLSNKQIAETLFLSNGTVRNYISLILEKTGLEHRTQIAVKYYQGK